MLNNPSLTRATNRTPMATMRSSCFCLGVSKNETSLLGTLKRHTSRRTFGGRAGKFGLECANPVTAIEGGALSCSTMLSALASIADRTSLTSIVLSVLPSSFCPSHPVACAEGRCVPGTRLLLMSTAFSLRRLSWPCRAEGSIRMLPGQVASGALACREKRELTTTSALACRAL